eukprot:2790814-Rhodomonas_salina.2
MAQLAVTQSGYAYPQRAANLKFRQETSSCIQLSSKSRPFDQVDFTSHVLARPFIQARPPLCQCFWGNFGRSPVGTFGGRRTRRSTAVHKLC